MYAIFLFLFLCSCSLEEESASPKRKAVETLTRRSGEFVFNLEKITHEEPPSYPWDVGLRERDNFPRITKEFFRCKGNSFNPPRTEVRGGETLSINDCGGSDKHSLPLIEGKEGVYPILIDLLNTIQEETGKRVVITSGHRCPDHNAYISSSPSNQVSKHLIGAEVSFYVQGYEDKPEQIAKLIQDYYLKDPQVNNDKRFTVFTRYEKEDTNVSTPPWMNQEIFIKLFKRHEGRDFDNRHPYPYLSLQVRYDRETKQKVIYSWNKAYNSFHRH